MPETSLSVEKRDDLDATLAGHRRDGHNGLAQERAQDQLGALGQGFPRRSFRPRRGAACVFGRQQKVGIADLEDSKLRRIKKGAGNLF